MSQDDYPHDPLVRRVWTSIERACMRRVSRVIFTAEATRQMYLKRYPDLLTPEICILISNGYDEEDFADLQISTPGPVPTSRPIRLVQSGLIYPLERDPRPIFSPLGLLTKMGCVSDQKVHFVLRHPR